MTNKRRQWIGIGLSLLVPAFVVAANLPYTFTAGTTIKASEVNSNFATLQARIDAITSIFSSGSRLASYGVSSTDGLRGVYTMQLFDTTIGAYCSPTPASDGKLRCLPGNAFTSSYRSIDATCTTPAKNLFELSPYINSHSPPSSVWPIETPTYIAVYSTDGGSSADIYTAVKSTKQVYDYGPISDGGYGCDLRAVDGGLYELGTLLPASSFVEMAVTKL